MNHDEDWSNECALSCINDIKNFGHLLVRRWRDLNFICPATVFTIEHRFCYINVIYLKTRVFIDICFNKARNTLAPDFVTNCFFQLEHPILNLIGKLVPWLPSTDPSMINELVWARNLFTKVWNKPCSCVTSPTRFFGGGSKVDFFIFAFCNVDL